MVGVWTVEDGEYSVRFRTSGEVEGERRYGVFC
jgi:hypothetical protein